MFFNKEAYIMNNTNPVIKILIALAIMMLFVGCFITGYHTGLRNGRQTYRIIERRRVDKVYSDDDNHIGYADDDASPHASTMPSAPGSFSPDTSNPDPEEGGYAQLL